ncbi:MAG: 50S ribosomal protein L17 [Candidatus Nealsonbacteria bacterium RIFCSPLOWO2_01_FULL_43_32]|uniref:Large ribosomal subunit protein bL17 n=1 Tax=Candidatus Nealsonbacteria bacterium RIFCSPLOWO2_01_FULL_43_32 TaxID=1801672 RepID=A0A1G2EGL7_9BACT|nr:MAG: 50S ribosomal protein L17 [Candidatus Nealsonbacteria bacterium RIFCSPLOWO2_01_FULL_43_32]
MQKRKKRRKLSREKAQRRALLKSLAASLILEEKIKTTEAKAKEARIVVETLITQAKKANLSSRKRLGRFFTPKVVKKLIDDVAPRYQSRRGGFTRIIKLGVRQSDGAEMALIELVK